MRPTRNLNVEDVAPPAQQGIGASAGDTPGAVGNSSRHKQARGKGKSLAPFALARLRSAVNRNRAATAANSPRIKVSLAGKAEGVQ
jgi:hypothetical protein